MFKMNEKGAVLPSVMIFVLLMSVAVLGTNQIFKNQMNQLRMTKHYYEVESMLILSKMELNSQLDLNKNLEKGTVLFTDGTVTIQKKGDNTFNLEGKLKNIFSKQLTVQLEKKSTEIKVQAEQRLSKSLEKKRSIQVR